MAAFTLDIRSCPVCACTYTTGPLYSAQCLRACVWRRGREYACNHLSACINHAYVHASVRMFVIVFWWSPGHTRFDESHRDPKPHLTESMHVRRKNTGPEGGRCVGPFPQGLPSKRKDRRRSYYQPTEVADEPLLRLLSNASTFPAALSRFAFARSSAAAISAR